MGWQNIKIQELPHLQKQNLAPQSQPFILPIVKLCVSLSSSSEQTTHRNSESHHPNTLTNSLLTSTHRDPSGEHQNAVSSPLGEVVEHREDGLGAHVSQVRGAALTSVRLLRLIDHLHHLIVHLEPKPTHQGVCLRCAAPSGVCLLCVTYHLHHFILHLPCKQILHIKVCV